MTECRYIWPFLRSPTVEKGYTEEKIERNELDTGLFQLRHCSYSIVTLLIYLVPRGGRFPVVIDVLACQNEEARRNICCMAIWCTLLIDLPQLVSIALRGCQRSGAGEQD